MQSVFVKRIILALVFISFFTIQSKAQSRYWSISAGSKIASFETPHFDDAYQLNSYHSGGYLGLERKLNPSLSFSVSGSLIPDLIQDQDLFYQANMLGRIHLANGKVFKKQAAVKPIFFSGFSTYNDGQDLQLAIPIDTGLNIKLAKRIMLNMNASYLVGVETTSDFTTASAGLTYIFKRKKEETKTKESSKVPKEKAPKTRTTTKKLKSKQDEDKDGITNGIDDCPYTFGYLQFYGCNDSDKDGIGDSKDKCPLVKGELALEGCPNLDRDNDNIPDSIDKCPDYKGPAKFNGCPDTDQDQIIDKLDKCPNKKGTLKFDGCPDSDNDNIPDHLDACPNEAGDKENNGCKPSTSDLDNDGILDKDDRCPFTSGIPKWKGCNDTDDDLIPDPDDECPFLAGTLKEKGCPPAQDMDEDGVADADDNCPNIKGKVALNGCPDADNDGIADLEDECPDLAGDKAHNGCPKPTAFSNQLYKTYSIYYDNNGSSSSNSEKTIAKVVGYLAKNPNWQANIKGFTDNTGNEEDNMSLSIKRAEEIFYKLANAGIEGNRITVLGYGEYSPKFDNNNPTEREKNRRVDIEVLR